MQESKMAAGTCLENSKHEYIFPYFYNWFSGWNPYCRSYPRMAI